MSELRYIDTTKTLVITSDTPIPASSDLGIKLLNALESMSSRIPLSSFDVWVPPNEPNKKLYVYRFIAKDARRWSQTLNISGQETYMTFAVNDKWLLSEFEQHRKIRDNIVEPLLRNSGVTKISCAWS